MAESQTTPRSGWREHWREIIFEADTPAGKAFDVVLLVLIAISLVAVNLESVASIAERYGSELRVVEWVLTVLFTAEYIVRLIVVRRPMHYAFSLFGIVDLLAVLPSYLGLVLTGTHSLLVIRVLRLLRIFRVFKMVRYLGEANVLAEALRGSLRKITVFLGTVVSITIIVGTIMYLVEGEESGFTSIPRSVYWAIVTLTTVGYGDIAPVTPLGQFIAALLMLTGYGIIAVPTGIVTAELVHAAHRDESRSSPAGASSPGKKPSSHPGSRARECASCGATGHAPAAQFCDRCGAALPPE